ncbi:MAG: SUMF1/EgtB/PvdO family nonheme iron enzyme [Pseudomonadota bacterium]|nr:SUMF1/EgtB/PvdO family nonheme iron enzyme [Pseudomonadota bacterium]
MSYIKNIQDLTVSGKQLLFAGSLLCLAIPVHADMVVIPAGQFMMGCSENDQDCEKDEGPQGGTVVYVPAFKLDRKEVTVEEYKQCMDSGKCTRPKDHARNKYCNVGLAERHNHPANCVDWSEAVSYCQWQGKRLPTEAEWEKAARADSSSRFPWGQEVSCTNAILDDGKTLASAGDEPDGCGEDRSWPVGSRPANALGLFDMHGNVGEWTSVWYTPKAIAEYGDGNLNGPEKGKQRVVRGGSWDENKKNLRSSFRNVKPPVSGKSVYGSIGFRCAKD